MSQVQTSTDANGTYELPQLSLDDQCETATADQAHEDSPATSDNVSGADGSEIASSTRLQRSNVSTSSTSRWRAFLGSPELVGAMSLATLGLTIIAVVMAVCSTLWASKSFTFGACVSLAQIDRFTESCNDTIAGGIPNFGIRQRSLELNPDSFVLDNNSFAYWDNRREFLTTSSVREFGAVFVVLMSGFLTFALSCVIDPLPLGSGFSGRSLMSEGSLLLRMLAVFASFFVCEVAFYGLYPKGTVAYVEIGAVLLIVGVGTSLSLRWRRLGLKKLKEG